MSQSDTAAPRFHIALIVSLCVNLILAGVIAMALLRVVTRPPEPITPPAAVPPGNERAELRQLLSPRMMFAIAPDKHDQIHAVLKAHREKVDALRAETVAARQEVRDRFIAKSFDKAGFEKALARLQKADSDLEVEVMKVSVELSGLLSPEERARAATFKRHGHGPGRGLGGRMGGGDKGWHHGREDGPDGGPAEAGPPDGDPPK